MPLSQMQVNVHPDHIEIEGYSSVSLPNIVFMREIRPRGANGLVFEALDSVLNRKVAIKILIPKKGDQRDRNLQAVLEARKIAQLNHNNIVQIYQCQELSNGLILSIMEYLEGLNLDEFLRISDLSFSDRNKLWNEINNALMYAHLKGIYHGDLHSRNVRVINGTIKIFDFGTSIFSGSQKSKSRESGLIVKLFNMLFPNDQPRISEILEINLSDLPPHLVLASVSAWLSIHLSWQEINLRIHGEKTSTRLDESLVHTISSLAFEICSTPVFSIQKILDMLIKVGVSLYIQDRFIDFCVRWCERFLSNSRVVYHPGRNRNENDEQLKLLWPNIIKAFYTKGPLF